MFFRSIAIDHIGVFRIALKGVKFLLVTMVLTKEDHGFMALWPHIIYAPLIDHHQKLPQCCQGTTLI